MRVEGPAEGGVVIISHFSGDFADTGGGFEEEAAGFVDAELGKVVFQREAERNAESFRELFGMEANGAGNLFPGEVPGDVFGDEVCGLVQGFEVRFGEVVAGSEIHLVAAPNGNIFQQQVVDAGAEEGGLLVGGEHAVADIVEGAADGRRDLRGVLLKAGIAGVAGIVVHFADGQVAGAEFFEHVWVEVELENVGFAGWQVNGVAALWNVIQVMAVFMQPCISESVEFAGDVSFEHVGEGDDGFVGSGVDA